MAMTACTGCGRYFKLTNPVELRQFTDHKHAVVRGRPCPLTGWSPPGTPTRKNKNKKKTQPEPEPEPNVMPTSGTHLGTVRGARFFTFDGHEFLTGAANGRWYSPRQKARCRDGSFVSWPHTTRANAADGVPHEHHRCGINMFSSHARELKFHFNDLHRFGMYQQVLALTEGWGKVIVHDDGFRVQQAEVKELIVSHYSPLSSINLLGNGWKNVPLSFHDDNDTVLDHIRKFCGEQQLTEIPPSEFL